MSQIENVTFMKYVTTLTSGSQHPNPGCWKIFLYTLNHHLIVKKKQPSSIPPLKMSPSKLRITGSDRANSLLTLYSMPQHIHQPLLARILSTNNFRNIHLLNCSNLHKINITQTKQKKRQKTNTITDQFIYFFKFLKMQPSYLILFFPSDMAGSFPPPPLFFHSKKKKILQTKINASSKSNKQHTSGILCYVIKTV